MNILRRMFWTEEHDVILFRETREANIPFANTKRGTVQRGRKWSEIAEHLFNLETPQFKDGQRECGRGRPACQDVLKEN